MYKIFMLLSIMWLAGCQSGDMPNGAQCLDPVDTSAYSDSFVTLPANSAAWTNTNVQVSQNSNFYMTVYNSVIMQSQYPPPSPAPNPMPPPQYQPQNVFIGYDPVAVAKLPCGSNPTLYPKIDTGITVAAGDLIAVAVVSDLQTSNINTTQYTNNPISGGSNTYGLNSILFLQDQNATNIQYCDNGTLENCKATNGQGVVLEIGDGSSPVPVSNSLNDPTSNFMSQRSAIFTAAIDTANLASYYSSYNSSSPANYAINTVVNAQLNPLGNVNCESNNVTPITCQPPYGAMAVFQAQTSGNLWLSNALYPAGSSSNYCSNNFTQFYGYESATSTTAYGYNLQISHYGQPVAQAQPITSDNAGAIEMYFASQISSVPQTPLLTDANYIVATGPYYSSTVPASGTIFMRVLSDPHSVAANNVGSYVIDLTTESPDYSNSISTLMDSIVSATLPAVKETVGSTYSGIIRTNTFQGIVYALVTLYIVLYAVYFLFGLTEISQVDLVVRVIKIALLLALINTGASWANLGNNFSTLFISGMDYIINAITNGITSSSTDPTVSSNMFNFVDISIDYMFTASVQSKLVGLIFDPSTVFIGVLAIWNVITYFFIVIEMLIAYLYAVVIICFLVSLTPFFLACILFEKTQALFDAWIKNIFYFVLQPIFIFLGVTLINKLIFITFFEMVSYEVCWVPMIDIYLPIFGVDVKLFSIYGYMQSVGDTINSNYSNPAQASIIPIGFTAQFGFVIFVQFLEFYLYNKMLSNYMGFAAELAGGITNVNASVAIAGKGSFAHSIASAPTKIAKKLTGMDKQSRQYRSNAGG